MMEEIIIIVIFKDKEKNKKLYFGLVSNNSSLFILYYLRVKSEIKTAKACFIDLEFFKSRRTN